MLKKKAKVEKESPITELVGPSEKDHLLDLLDELKARNIRSVGDLENQIANAE